jgi:hypothetical protein
MPEEEGAGDRPDSRCAPPTGSRDPGFTGASILLSSPAGYRTDHFLAANFNPTLALYTPDQAGFLQRLLDQTRNLAGVRSAALAQAVPIVPGGGFTRRGAGGCAVS